MSSWSERRGQVKPPPRRPDRHVMFVVLYRDGSRSFVRIPPSIAAFGAGPVAMRFAADEQRRGRLQPGTIERLARVR